MIIIYIIFSFQYLKLMRKLILLFILSKIFLKMKIMHTMKKSISDIIKIQIKRFKIILISIIKLVIKMILMKVLSKV